MYVLVIDCGSAPMVNNATVHTKSQTFGSEARYSCLPDHEHSGGDRTKVCGPDGLWTGDDIFCQC